ncbi:chaperone protein dnaJ 49-like [Senna tora]|uniref:Chaperone protein dnaJ 49-like n=1 Tax=Senna tora TaxID=362788 RepID=A0A834W2A3_9FABA|nr:chaperone protein dnaJ 49-like [Senna tora]
MEGNKDDALKCLKIGKHALEAGDRARALKFVTKARRLDPTLPVDDLLSAIEKETDDQPAAAPTANGQSGSSPSKPSDKPSIRHRGSPTLSSSSSSATYTEEQITIVREIRRKKNYYEILGLDKSNCTVEDVRKAYRKLSLKVHPDKNKAPGAEEAFKSVSKAFQCLSNEESRRKYDLVGEDDNEPATRQRARAYHHHHHGYYDADIDAEEIFRNFFFGGMAPATTPFGGFSFGPGMRHRPAEHGSSGVNLRALIQLLPILLVVLLNFLPSSDPIYMLSRSYPYTHRFTTTKGVNYYVKSSTFAQDYPLNSPERTNLEAGVEKEYSSILSQNCRLELQRRQWGYIQETPHCDMLRNFKN